MLVKALSAGQVPVPVKEKVKCLSTKNTSSESHVSQVDVRLALIYQASMSFWYQMLTTCLCDWPCGVGVKNELLR